MWVENIRDDSSVLLERLEGLIGQSPRELHCRFRGASSQRFETLFEEVKSRILAAWQASDLNGAG